MAEEIFYKIKRRSDGLFSTGGHDPRFTNKGKVWKTIGYIRSHLENMGLKRGTKIYENCEIIELIASENILCSVSTEIEKLERRAEELQQKRIEVHRLRLEAKEKELRNEELNTLKQLIEKYPEFKNIEVSGKIIKHGNNHD